MVPANKAKIGHVLGEEIPERLLKPGENLARNRARISAMASDSELLTQVRSAVQLLLRKNEESVIAFLQPRVEQSLLAALDRNLTPENLRKFWDDVLAGQLASPQARERIASASSPG
ncbi:MAG: hypothetical protein V8T86_01055 [Victivallis sp.]